MNGHDKKERADVVILTYHPDERFTECIRRFKKQAEPPGHIYVVNTRTDCFPEEVERMEGVTVKHIDWEEFDHGATRDMGFSLSDAGIVIFMTQDALPADKELTANLVRPLLDSEKIGISYARQLPAKDCGMIERYTRNFNYPNESRVKGQEDISELGIKTFFCSDVCAAYKRSIYQEMGGFIRHTIFNEDMIMAAKMVRAGYQIAYAAEARVVHSHNYTGEEF